MFLSGATKGTSQVHNNRLHERERSLIHLLLKKRKKYFPFITWVGLFLWSSAWSSNLRVSWPIGRSNVDWASSMPIKLNVFPLGQNQTTSSNQTLRCMFHALLWRASSIITNNIKTTIALFIERGRTGFRLRLLTWFYIMLLMKIMKP